MLTIQYLINSIRILNHNDYSNGLDWIGWKYEGDQLIWNYITF